MKVLILIEVLLVVFAVVGCDSRAQERVESSPSDRLISSDPGNTELPVNQDLSGVGNAVRQGNLSTSWIEWHPNTLRLLLPWNLPVYRQKEQRYFNLSQRDTVTNISVELVFELKGIKPVQPVVKMIEPGSYILEIDMPIADERVATRVLMHFTIEHSENEVHHESFCFYARNPLMDSVDYREPPKVELDETFDTVLCKKTSVDKLIS